MRLTASNAMQSHSGVCEWWNVSILDFPGVWTRRVRDTFRMTEYCLFYRAVLQKRPIILSILLTVATPPHTFTKGDIRINPISIHSHSFTTHNFSRLHIQKKKNCFVFDNGIVTRFFGPWYWQCWYPFTFIYNPELLETSKLTASISPFNLRP